MKNNNTIHCVFVEMWFSVVGPSVQMPLLSSKFLQKHRELRLAHLALGVMTMGYVWQEGENDTAEVTLCLSVFLFAIFTVPFLLPSCTAISFLIFHF